MQQKFCIILLLSLAISLGKSDDNNQDKAKVPCDSKQQENCGKNTDCSSSNGSIFCSCKKGFSGDPLFDCFKMNEESPCDPNPCGSNAECFAENDEIGPHCRCKKGFYNWPPKCQEGCETHSDCQSTQICNENNSCEDLCDPMRCGENSICRIDKNANSVHCSCKDGYEPKDTCQKIPTELKESCKCGENAYCVDKSTCVCTQGYSGDPKNKCELVENDRIDPCNPNPCGGYSTCKVVNNEAKCSCVEGYENKKICFKCKSDDKCISKDFCANGKCHDDVCESYCGSQAECNIFEKKFECSCKIQIVNDFNKPFEGCQKFEFLPSNVIAVVSG